LREKNLCRHCVVDIRLENSSRFCEKKISADIVLLILMYLNHFILENLACKAADNLVNPLKAIAKMIPSNISCRMKKLRREIKRLEGDFFSLLTIGICYAKEDE
jgi:hypothetical protein